MMTEYQQVSRRKRKLHRRTRCIQGGNLIATFMLIDLLSYHRYLICLICHLSRASSNGDTKEGGGIWDAPLQVAKEKAIYDL